MGVTRAAADDDGVVKRRSTLGDAGYEDPCAGRDCCCFSGESGVGVEAAFVGCCCGCPLPSSELKLDARWPSCCCCCSCCCSCCWRNSKLLFLRMELDVTFGVPLCGESPLMSMEPEWECPPPPVTLDILDPRLTIREATYCWCRYSTSMTSSPEQ